MRPTTRFSAHRLPQYFLAAALLASAGTAHATSCVTGQSSVLYQGLPSEFGDHDCYVAPSNPDPQWKDSGDAWKHFTWYDLDGKQWEGWHHQRFYKDGKDCTPSPVPLPASSWLLVSGALAMLALARRRREATL
ncbi:MAG: VPLPA-CTERM sorting domain-containing protein [Steroidobacteraceae bacterium]